MLLTCRHIGINKRKGREEGELRSGCEPWEEEERERRDGGCGDLESGEGREEGDDDMLRCEQMVSSWMETSCAVCGGGVVLLSSPFPLSPYQSAPAVVVFWAIPPRMTWPARQSPKDVTATGDPFGHGW
jgi:hypothetical protein